LLPSSGAIAGGVLRHLALLLAAVPLLAVLWLLLPSPVGAGARPVAVRGTSMLPALRSGDLAVVFPARAYLPGDVVAYRSPLAGGRVLIHRVVGYGPEGKLVTRGDNNPREDSYQPRQEEVMGRMRWRLPLLGYGILRPELTAAAAGGAAAASLAAGKSRRRRAVLVAPAAILGASLAGLALVLAGVLSLALVTRLSPTVTARVPVTLSHSGEWSYGASTTVPVYDRGTEASAGDPIFLPLSDRVHVSFRYRSPPSLASPEGTLTLYARLGDYVPTGWRRTIPIAGPVSLGSTGGEARGDIDVRGARAMWEELQRLLGQQTQTPARLVLTAEVVLRGTDAGRPIEDRATFELPYRLDPAQLLLEPPQNVQDTAQLLRPRLDRTLIVQEERPRSVGVGAIRLDLASVEAAAPYLLAGGSALLLLTLLATLLAQRTPAGQASLAGAVVVPGGVSPQGQLPVVRVTSPQALARAARTAGVPVVSADDGALWAATPGVLYLYAPPSSQREAAQEPGDGGPGSSAAVVR